MTFMLLLFTSLLLTYLAMSQIVPNESISSHVLNTMTGLPAEGVSVIAHIQEGDKWEKIGETVTANDGRVKWVSPDFALRKGIYKLRFDVEGFYRKRNTECFYPFIEVVFKVDDPTRHYHIPLILSPYAYSTYRGS